MSKKIAIALDDWKLPTYKKHLDAAGFKFDQADVPNRGIIVLTIVIDDSDVDRLIALVHKMNAEAYKRKMH